MRFIEEVPKKCMYCDNPVEYIAVDFSILRPSLKTVCNAHRMDLLGRWKWIEK